MSEIAQQNTATPRMEWAIEALKVLRQVRDWTRKRANNGVRRSAQTHDVLKQATERVEVTLAEDAAQLVAPIGPASVPPIARKPVKNPAPSSARRDLASRRHEIPIEQIDPNAINAVRRLRSFGFKAYLVGGCVRDLMLGLRPKDFDVSTDARPEEIKRVFRNSRIIGRRFRLVHLYFRGGDMIEVSTFRANLTPDEEQVEDGQDLMVRRDNVFGTEEEDALRRDFTINGLFYDVHTGKIIDHVGGIEDVRQRYLRMIGDPEIRLREDPVRILRAIRFTAKAKLRVDPELREAMRRHASEVPRCAPARITEETLKLLRGGLAEAAVQLMDEMGLLRLLMPEIKGYLDGVGLPEDAPKGSLERRAEGLYAHLHALDNLAHLGPVSDVVILGALICAPLETYVGDADDAERGQRFDDFLAVAGKQISITRKISESLRQILVTQRNLGSWGEAPGTKRRRRPTPEATMGRASFPDALNLYEIRLHANEQPLDEVDAWYKRIEEDVGRPVEHPLTRDMMGPVEHDDTPQPRRPRRRRR